MPHSTNCIVDQFKKVAQTLKVIRILFSTIGIIAIPVGQILRDADSSKHAILGSYIFWIGVIAIFFAGIILAAFERDSVSLTLKVLELEEEVDERERHISYLSWREDIFLSWLAVTKLLSELLDQTLTTAPLTPDKQKLIYTAVVEIIAEYKQSIFKIGEEYCNISLYKKMDTELLECVACYRSRPSDANIEHRKWKIGEGHVGKAFELQRELICANANNPDIKPWISASPENSDAQDESRYVSLAAVPIAANAEEPKGVLIVTSSEPMRFTNSDEDHGDDDTREKRRLSVAALQDFAAQVGQIMLAMELRSVSTTTETRAND